MLRSKPRTRPTGTKPVMIMLHGSGSSAAIFGIQTHFLAKELSQTFDLVFLDAPTPSTPGPGVLPLFAGMPGYFRWLTTIDSQASAAMQRARAHCCCTCRQRLATTSYARFTTHCSTAAPWPRMHCRN